MIVRKLLRRIAGDKLPYIIHICGPSVNARYRCLPFSSPLEISRISAAPFPGVVKIKHSFHVATLKLRHKIVKSGKKSVVVHAGSGLQYRTDMRGKPLIAVTTHEYAQIVYAVFLQQVKLSCQTFAVTATAFRCKDRTVPEISAYEAIHAVAYIKFAVAHGDKITL